jgi:hypothetical protein
MRKLLLLILLVGVGGCQAFGLAGRKKDTDSRSGSDPFYSPDLEEQQKFGRSRYSYPEDDRGIAPPSYSGRPTPSGR